MAEQQQKTMDSVGMPSTGGFDWRKTWKQAFNGLQFAVIKAYANELVKVRTPTRKEFEELKADINHDRQVNQELRQQLADALLRIEGLEKYCENISGQLKLAEHKRIESEKLALSVQADARYMQRTIERLNNVIELIVWATGPVPWLKGFINKLDDKRNSLDARLSKHDQKDIKDLVGMPMDHPKRRATDSD